MMSSTAQPAVGAAAVHASPRSEQAPSDHSRLILNRYVSVLLLGVTLLGMARHERLLALAGLLSLAVLGAELLWARFCLTGVEYERKVWPTHAFWGEEAQVTTRIANRKLLPLTWLLVEDQTPERLDIGVGSLAGLGLVRGEFTFLLYLRSLLSMMPYQQVLRRHTVQCRHRGLFEFGPSRLESGDLLGFTSRTIAHPEIARLLVYPKVFELDVPQPLSLRLIGPRATDRMILTDPSRTIGVRSYQPGDPLRHVEWRASARSRELLVRVFEPTTDPSAAIFINSTVARLAPDSYDPPELEFCISLAASIAKWMLDRGCPVGVFGNSEPSGPGAVHVPVASHPEQLRRVLETLALATPFGSVRRNRGTWWKGYVEADLRGAFVRPQLGQLLLREGSRLPFETSVAVVTAAVDAEVLTACRQLQRHRPLTVFYVQTPFGPARPDLRELHVVRVPYSEQWEDDERLQLAG